MMKFSPISVRGIRFLTIIALLIKQNRMKSFFYSLILVAFPLLAWNLNRPLPKLFLIGDSISIQYGPYLEKYLEGTVIYERKQDDGQADKNLDVPTGANGGDSRMVLAYLRTRMNHPAFNPDFMVLNCGLHDIKRDIETGQLQVNSNEYRENLEAIISLLGEKDIKIIWIRTTPVVDSIHNTKSRSFHRHAADLEIYNQIADEIFYQNNIPVIDLFNFTRQLGDDQFIDHVHYSDKARDLQAAFIAGFLQSYLKNNLR